MTHNHPNNKHHRFEMISGTFAKCKDCGYIHGALTGGEIPPCTSPRAAKLRWRTIGTLKTAVLRLVEVRADLATDLLHLHEAIKAVLDATPNELSGAIGELRAVHRAIIPTEPPEDAS